MLFLDKQFCVCFFLGGEGGRAEQKKLPKKNAVASGLCLYSWEPQNLSQRIETYPVSPSKLWTCSLRGNLQGWTWIHQVFFFNFWSWEPFFFRGNLLGLTKAPLQIMNLFDWTWTHQVFYFNFWSWECRAHSKGFGPTKSCNPFSLRGNFFGLTKVSLQIMNLFTSGKPPRLDPGPPSLSKLWQN